MDVKDVLLELKDVVAGHTCIPETFRGKVYYGALGTDKGCPACAQGKLWEWITARPGCALMLYDRQALDETLGRGRRNGNET